MTKSFSLFVEKSSKNAEKDRARAWTRKLALENLESRELLSASGWEGAVELARDATAFVAAPQDAFQPLDLDIEPEDDAPELLLPSKVPQNAFPVELADSAASLQSLTVTTVADTTNASDGVVSLREAIALAGTTGYSSTITFSSSLKGKTITLANGELTIERSITIDARALIDAELGGPGVTIDATGGRTRIFHLDEAGDVAIVGLKLTGGVAEKGGAIYSYYSDLTLDSCVISGNNAASGGGVYVYGYGATTIKNTVIADNHTTTRAGGLYSAYADELEIVNSTIVSNKVDLGGSTYGGGIWLRETPLNLKNSILAANEAGRHPDLYNYGRESTINGLNVLTNFSAWTTFDKIVPFYSLTETFVDPASGDYRLSSISPALDAGNKSFATTSGLTKDVGGRARVVGSSVDLGAYERADGDPTSARRAEDYHNDFFVDTVFYDADKKMDDGDGELCWAAAASNALWFTKWGQVGGFTDEEDVFHNAFEACFPNDGGKANLAFQWFIDRSAYTSKETSVGGGYYARVMGMYGDSAENYIAYSDDLYDQSIIELTNALRSGCGATISIGWYDVSTGERASGHALSVYGYSYNPHAESYGDYVTKLYVADSNDYGRLSGQLDRKLRTLELVWDETQNAFVVEGYRYKDDCVLLLDKIQFLAQRPYKYDASPRTSTNLYFFEDFNSPPRFFVSCQGSEAYVNNREMTLHFPFQSSTAISSGIKYEVFVDDVSYGVYTTSAVAQGRNDVSVALGKLSSGAHVVSVALDPNDAIYESNDQDNFYATTFVVGRATADQLATPTATVSSTTTTSATIDWNSVYGAASYTVQYRLSGATSWTTQTASASSLTATVSGLKSGSKYEFRVRANGDGGANYLSSEFSASVFATTKAVATKLAPPSDLLTSGTNNSITVYWKPLSGAKSFTVQYKLKTASEWQSVGAQGTATSATISGLSKGKEYEIRVRANGDGGETRFSSEFSKTLTVKAQPKLAFPELANSATENSLTVYWTPIANAKSYAVQYKLSTASDWSTVSAQGTATSKTIVGLAKGKEYEIRVRANGDGGATWYSSDYSRVLTATTQPKLARPELALAGSTNNSITVAWDALAGAKSYTLQYKLATASEWTNVGARATDASKELSGLTKGKTYEIRIRANGDGGATWYSSDYSAVLTAAVDNRTLATPTLTVASKKSDSISLSWNAIANAKSYVLQYKLATSSAWSSEISLASSKTTHTISGLNALTKYDFQIRAVGNGSTSFDSKYGSTSGTTTSAAKQLAAPNAAVVGATANSISLSWSAISGAKSYSIEYKLSTASTWTTKSVASTTTSATLTGLTRGAKYQIRMRAVGDGTNYLTSPYGATQTQIAAPKLASPTLKNVGSTANSITIGWQKVSCAKSYTIQYKVSTSSEWTTTTAQATATSKTISGLTKGKTYEFQIRANGDGGATYLSSEFSAKMTATAETKLFAPQLVATQTEEGIALSWNAIAGAKSYTLQYRASGASGWTNVGIRATETSYAFSNLATGAYEFQIRANGDGGATCKSSEWSEVVSARIVGRLASPTPRPNWTGLDSITVSWDAIEGAKSYTLQYKRADANEWSSIGVAATQTSCVVAGLADGSWQFRLRANGDGGATCKSSEFSAVQSCWLGLLSPAFDPIEPEFDDELLIALAENWR